MQRSDRFGVPGYASPPFVMPDASTLVAFAAIVAAFAAVPGPSNLYVVAQGLRAGRRPALSAAVGCALGAMVYVAATTLGLVAILASSATALSVLHYVGGAYLLLLGWRSLRDGRPQRPPDHRYRGSDRRFLLNGVLVELMNPKVALFFLAFFPQFVDTDRGAAWSQILVLGALFCVVGLVSDSLYALGSGTVRARLSGDARLMARASRASGTLYVGLGAWAIWSGTRTEAR